MGDGSGCVMIEGKMQDDATVKQCHVMVAPRSCSRSATPISRAAYQFSDAICDAMREPKGIRIREHDIATRASPVRMVRKSIPSRAAGEAVVGVGVDHDRVARAELGEAVVERAAAREHDEELVVIVVVRRHAEVRGHHRAVHEEAALAAHDLLAPGALLARLLHELARALRVRIEPGSGIVPLDLLEVEDARACGVDMTNPPGWGCV
jgi:hypothetical protein